MVLHLLLSSSILLIILTPVVPTTQCAESKYAQKLSILYAIDCTQGFCIQPAALLLAEPDETHSIFISTSLGQGTRAFAILSQRGALVTQTILLGFVFVLQCCRQPCSDI